MATVKKQERSDDDFQMAFYEQLLRRRPKFIDVLIALGEIYTKKGFFEKGLLVDQKLSQLRPDNPIVHYNLACSLSLVGDVPNSFKAIKQAIRLGYDDFQYMVQDPDLTNLRRDERFERFFRQLRKIAPPAKNARRKRQ